MKFLRLLVIVLALMLIPATAHAKPIERKYGSGAITVAAAALKEYGCFYHPYSATVTIGPETTNWFASLDVIAPNGSVHSKKVTGISSAPGVVTVAGAVFLCSTLDANKVGTWTITGMIHSTNIGGSGVAESPLTPATFVLSPYAAPAPPAPVPTTPAEPVASTPAAPVYADVSGSASSKAVSKGVKLTLKSNAIPTGATVGKNLTWTVIADGKIKKTITQGASKITTVTLKFKARSGMHLVKVLRNGKVAKTVRVRA